MNKNLPLKREFSSGAVVYKKTANKLLFLLGKHSGYHKWVLPKGLIEKGEKGINTAARETEEEMGVKAKLISDKPIHKETYFYFADFKKEQKDTRRVAVYQEEGGGKIKVFKTVTFYLMEYVAGDPEEHGWEMEDSGWFEYKKALELMSFEGEKKALEKANKAIK